jgi:hypothetical protein
MPKRTIKRDVILGGIDKEIATVKADIATAEAEMAVHRSNLSSLYAVEHALEKLRKQTAASLAPQPRQSAAMTDTKATPRCTECGYVQASISHKDTNLPDYHEFVSPQKPKKKSSTKKQAGLPVGCVATPATPRRSPTCSQCGTGINDSSHTNNVLADFHPFVSSIPADSAQPPSSANDGESNGTASSEVETVAAGVVAHGASGD